MDKVLCLSSQVVWGPVGNSAAVPALQAEGHEVLQVPTVLLSHHPGHGKPAVLPVKANTMTELLTSVAGKAALQDCAAVMTGYFAEPTQVSVAADLITRLRLQLPSLMVLVDPVMGDHGRLYVPLPVAEAIRDQLSPLANITTPNSFELGWLTGKPVGSLSEATAAAATLTQNEVIVTSIATADDTLGTLLLTNGTTRLNTVAKRAHVPHGTGDFLAGCYLAHRLKHSAQHAFDKAMDRLSQAIAASGESKVLRTS
jgi:pyridoxine kinase